MLKLLLLLILTLLNGGVLAIDLPPGVMEGILERSLWNRGKDYSLPVCSSSTIKVAVLGGSVSCGHGAARAGYGDLLEINSHNRHESDPALPKIDVVVAAIPGTGVLEPTACLYDLVGDPDQYDVFITEFSINEFNQTDTIALFELLGSLPRKPLVLVLDYFSKLYNGIDGGPGHKPPVQAAPGQQKPLALPVVVTAIEMDLTVVSLRTALAPIYGLVPPINDHDLYYNDEKQHMNDLAHELMYEMLYYHLFRMSRRPDGRCDEPQIGSAASVPSAATSSVVGVPLSQRMCYSSWILSECSDLHRSRVPTTLSQTDFRSTVPSLLEAAVQPLSKYWAYIPPVSRGKAYVGTVTNTKEVVGDVLQLNVKSEVACNLRLTALVCSKPPYCELGAIDLTLSSWKTSDEMKQEGYSTQKFFIEPYNIPAKAVQMTIFSTYVKAGYSHHFEIASSSLSTTGYYGVKLIGMYCS